MAYDPQARRRRPKPAPEGPTPVDALLLADPTDSSRGHAAADDFGTDESSQVHDPPPTPAVTPEPANPPPDKLLLNSALVSAAAALVGALLLRYIWRRWFRTSVQTQMYDKHLSRRYSIES